MFSFSASSSCRNANRTLARLARDASPHSAHAALAAATTSPTVSADARSTWPVTCPVAGL